MFIVANVSKGIIVIPDLGIEIPRNQSRDLHKIHTKIPPENSKDLKNATGSGMIKEVKRDKPPPGTRTEHTEHTKHTHEKVIQKTQVIREGANKDEIVQALFEKFKKEMPFLSGQEEKEEAPSTKILMEMLKRMDKLDNAIKSGSSSGNNSNQKREEDEDELEVDPKLLAQIHARRIENLTKNSEGEISLDQSEEKDESMSSGLDELEDLLG